MKSVFDRLDAQPETVEIIDPRTKLKVKVIVNKFVMQYIVANNIGTTVTARFPALFYRASKGDFTNPAQVWLNQSRSGIGSAMSYMMDCASGQTAARRELHRKRSEGTLLEDFSNFPFPDVCRGVEGAGSRGCVSFAAAIGRAGAVYQRNAWMPARR